MSVRVVHLSTVHTALDVRIFHKECRSLAAAGYEVHLVAPKAPTETSSGVKLHALDLPRGGPRVWRIWRRWRNAYRIAVQLRAAVYHFHDPDLIPVGLFLKRTGARVVYDVHEDAPRQALHLFPGEPLRAWLYRIVWLLLEGTAKLLLDGFVCATPLIARRFPAGRSVVLQNFPLLEEFVSPPLEQGYRLASPGPAIVLYVGNIFAARGIREMVSAVGLVAERYPARLHLVGEFSPPELRDELEQHPGWRHVDFAGWQTREGVVASLARAKVGLVLLHPTPQYVESYPVKLFEYMAAGLPVVASDFPLWRTIVEGAGCGLLVDPLDTNAIAAAIGFLLERPLEARAMGRRGREAVFTRYSWEAERLKLLSLYAALTEGADSRGAGTEI